MFPHFYCIGAQKAGTTWLRENLRKNPNFYFGHFNEIHFYTHYYQFGWDWYFNIFSGCKENQKTGDITPNYCLLKEETIKLIYEKIPNLKIIYILREPIDRAFSGIKMRMIQVGYLNLIYKNRNVLYEIINEKINCLLDDFERFEDKKNFKYEFSNFLINNIEKISNLNQYIKYNINSNDIIKIVTDYYNNYNFLYENNLNSISFSDNDIIDYLEYEEKTDTLNNSIEQSLYNKNICRWESVFGKNTIYVDFYENMKNDKKNFCLIFKNF